jgi:tRNA (guanine-N7-)-methyltransferase
MPQPARTTAPFRERPVSFVRRGRHLAPSLQRAWDAQAPRYLVDVERAAATTSVHPSVSLDPDDLFPGGGPLVVEVGSGQGDAVVAAAQREPGARFLAVEVYEPGLAHTARSADAAGVDNLRLVQANAPEVLAALPAGSVRELWVFFPDPWRKARHTKRRLVDADFLRQAARVLEPSGVLRLATDWAAYADQMRDLVAADPELDNPHAATGGWAPRFEGRVLTSFERKGTEAGRTIRDLAAVRRGADPVA